MYLAIEDIEGVNGVIWMLTFDKQNQAVSQIGTGYLNIDDSSRISNRCCSALQISMDIITQLLSLVLVS